ncbi:PIG-L family deacetylase [Aliifodinibius sp. S!AR15-10]|uniref:PIG-L family deacetylase n=1 Tax=Aliifodinibius sp. S!AR15-10 TaxID=2950437 RepID=UPI002856F01E|nr:PIG-L family deacetylase [Aliifodinibius sp. S!AR15-10]MDR8390533.1 PIG-L family deacetylase [Aliifodinibius sp. S!AR15-10]
MKKTTPLFFLFLLLLLCIQQPLKAQELDYKPKVLLVTAHPDDDAIYAATVFKTTHLLDGVADLAIMTNGEGGYRYSTLGNYIYGKRLDKEEVGRANLPGIRKKEVMAGGDIVGIRNYYFFEQQDKQYTEDIQKALDMWDAEWLEKRLQEIIEEEQYDFVLTMLPQPGTHGHHKASALLALQAVENMQPEERPIILGTTIFRETDGETDFEMLEGYPLTSISQEHVPLTFDRTQKFGFEDRLNYNIIANWVIAEHKSQGTMQLFMNGVKVEVYLYYDINRDEDYAKAKAYFDAVNAAEMYKRD